ncbi:hypothetical protein F5148DRAFT_1215252 [Russula earlei]|uniref:Uncharacterized protein n=1 Tax=Russula earlei TaxID=71964 RepID=A0ACC0U3K3_9AGAM|nr:hypothetical protein F5148DRAFT_1215252 [Russula earlei]
MGVLSALRTIVRTRSLTVVFHFLLWQIFCSMRELERRTGTTILRFITGFEVIRLRVFVRMAASAISACCP